MLRLRLLLCGVPFLICTVQAEVTYSREISRIMQANCQQCHRPNDVAPFELTKYDDVASHVEGIKQALTSRIMPPWKPVPGFGEFRDSLALAEDDRRLILEWINAGAPEGDPADLPEPLPVSETPWQLGDPDLILSMPEFTPPRGRDTYRCFVLPTGLAEDRFVSAAQALPGAKETVHHVILFLDSSGTAEKLDGQDGQPGYTCFGGPGVPLDVAATLGGWVPGMRTRRLPEGIGLPLPRKAKIVMQVHYHPHGFVESDRTQVGLWFSPSGTVKQRLIYFPVGNTRFEIPAGASNFQVQASQIVPPGFSAKAITIAPHMHLLGRTIKVEIQAPDGTRQPMIYIDDWDFNWQGIYTFAEPMKLAGGSTVRVTATYDNSENNLRNPNSPPQAVHYGEATTDEMCFAFIGAVFDIDNPRLF